MSTILLLSFACVCASVKETHSIPDGSLTASLSTLSSSLASKFVAFDLVSWAQLAVLANRINNNSCMPVFLIKCIIEFRKYCDLNLYNDQSHVIVLGSFPI